ncbi:hypothetical protein Bca4012_008873 [Brassica carinata]
MRSSDGDEIECILSHEADEIERRRQDRATATRSKSVPFSNDKRYAAMQVKAPPQLLLLLLQVLLRDIWVFEKSLFRTGACCRLCGRIEFPSKDIIQPVL